MKIKIIDDRPINFNEAETGWSKTADHDNDRWLQAMEHLANAYDLLKDQVISLEVGPMFGDELFIHVE